MPEFRTGDRVIIRKSATVTTPQAHYIQDNQLPGFVEAVDEQTGEVFVQVFERGTRYIVFVPPDALWLLDSDEARQESE